MERRRVAAGKRTNQRADAVRVAHRERTVLQQAANLAERIGRRAGRLQNKPLVHHQTILVPFVIVFLHQRIAARQFSGNACRQGRERIGHVIRFVILFAHQRVRQPGLTKRKVAQAGIAQGTLADIRMLHAIGIKLVGVVERQELVRQFGRQRAGQRFAHRHNGNRVDDVEQLRNFSRGRQRQNFSRQRRVNLLVQQDGAERVCHMHRQRQRLSLLVTVHVQLDVGCQQALRRIPTREIVARMAHQERQLLVAPFVLQLHRRGEFAQQRRHRLEVNVIEDKGLLCLGHVQNVVNRMAALL